MIKHSPLLAFVFVLLFTNVKAQPALDSLQLNKEYTNLNEALKNPEKVYRLNLSNQKLQFSDSIWSQFTNLQYLSFKNDHLKEIPEGVGFLKNLKVLDLSGNDFEVLPSSFENLTNLEELFLNDDKFLKFEKNIPVLSTLPNLKTLHIENDGLKSLPKDIYKLSHLESLYLNNNRFKQMPIEIEALEKLQFIDFHDNEYRLPIQDMQNENRGYKIRF
ncbi:MAG: Leucine-rich repeat (LRR) protein [Cryomorphaceae bacterium]|jgi:Leucine-rich repeat (LRR) protein